MKANCAKQLKWFTPSTSPGPAKACTYLAQKELQSLEELGAQSPQLKDKGWAAVLDVLTEPLSASLRRQITTVDAAAFRHKASGHS